MLTTHFRVKTAAIVFICLGFPYIAFLSYYGWWIGFKKDDLYLSGPIWFLVLWLTAQTLVLSYRCCQGEHQLKKHPLSGYCFGLTFWRFGVSRYV